jgi:hypothetical protein
MAKINLNIEVKTEGSRGCGYRKEGGYYLMLEKVQFHGCGKLPLPLEKCPCCGAGIKFSRGWTWINGKLLFEKVKCTTNLKQCPLCILDHPPERMGLLWIGEKFYPTPQDWIDEGNVMGISRRIKNVPKGFVIGETWVAVAHIRAIPKTEIYFTDKKEETPARPAIFQVFKPSHVEYIVAKKDTKKKLRDLEKKGIKLVRVIKKGEKNLGVKQQELF